MARAVITKQVPVNPDSGAGLAMTMQTMDQSNGMCVALTGSELIIVRNPDSSAHTVTITSTADERGRLGSITADSIAASGYRVYGPFTNMKGWAQTDGTLNIDCNSALLTIAVLDLPSIP